MQRKQTEKSWLEQLVWDISRGVKHRTPAEALLIIQLFYSCPFSSTASPKAFGGRERTGSQKARNAMGEGTDQEGERGI